MPSSADSRFLSADFFTVPLLRGHKDELAASSKLRAATAGEFSSSWNFTSWKWPCRAVGAGFRQLIHLQPINAAFRRKQQNVAVRRSDKEILDESSSLSSPDALCRTRLMPYVSAAVR